MDIDPIDGSDLGALLGVRELFATLHKAHRSIRLYPRGHRLRETAFDEFVCCARKVLARGPLSVRIADDGVWLDAFKVLDDEDSDGLCRDLLLRGAAALDVQPDADDVALRRLAEVSAPPADGVESGFPTGGDGFSFHARAEG